MKILENFRSKRVTIVPALLVITVLSFTPMAHAYGPSNWQTAFAGTFIVPGSSNGGSGGFWGWCDFAGGTASGSEADCQIAMYFPPDHSFQSHMSISGTAWDMELATIHPPIGPITNDFFITAGTMSLTARFSGPPPPGFTQNCTLQGGTATCPISFWESIGVYNPDTGIPAAGGHYNLSNFFLQGNQVGELQIQVTQVQ